MKRLVLAAATVLALASSASAGGMAFSLPNLWFPSSDDVTVSKSCLSSDAASTVCAPQE